MLLPGLSITNEGRDAPVRVQLPIDLLMSTTDGREPASMLREFLRRAPQPQVNYGPRGCASDCRIAAAQWSANAPREDRHFAFLHPDLNVAIMGVLDGHGGPSCADFAAGVLPHLVSRRLEWALSPQSTRFFEDLGVADRLSREEPDVTPIEAAAALYGAFLETEARWMYRLRTAKGLQPQAPPWIAQETSSRPRMMGDPAPSPVPTFEGARTRTATVTPSPLPASPSSGTCALALVLGRDWVVVANAGDCRAIMVSDHASAKAGKPVWDQALEPMATPLSIDHSCTHEGEVARVRERVMGRDTIPIRPSNASVQAYLTQTRSGGAPLDANNAAAQQ
jgi:hypothetical protein